MNINTSVTGVRHYFHVVDPALAERGSQGRTFSG
jgi:hypothetical protein